MHLLRALLTGVLLATAIRPAAGQTVSDSTPPPAARPALAVAEALAVNLFVNRVDAWVFADDWARVRPRDWRRNLRLGWEWDENVFGTNMFAHPFHGSLYFNAARSNGLTYWQAAPVAFLGSWTWEYLAETFRPALNDFVMTSFGGIALGEVFHRVGASIRDNQATGRSRTMRELAALPVDPIGSLNRLVRGQWQEVSANPPEHGPGAYVLRVSTGGRLAVDDGYVHGDPIGDINVRPALSADLDYGDPLRTPYSAPFDVFSLRAQLTGTATLNALRINGRLFATDLNRPTSSHRHVFAVNHRYEYVDNAAHKFGAQSVEAGVHSSWRLSRHSRLRTDLFGDGIILGALDAPDTGAGERTYDFGPGGGFRFNATYERSGIGYLSVITRYEYVHSVSGARADHHVNMGGTEVTIPVAAGLGIGVQSNYYQRRSAYSDRPGELREFPELRLLLTWTGAALAAPPR